jgi:hypothetical protein
MAMPATTRVKAQRKGPITDRPWQFMNITEPGQARSEEFKGQVKTNAMRDYRRFQRLKRMEEYSKEKGSPKSTSQLTLVPAFLTQSTEASLISIKRVSASSNEKASPNCDSDEQRETENTVCNHPRSILGAGMVDPFETCATGGRKAYFPLINHCQYAS